MQSLWRIEKAAGGSKVWMLLFLILDLTIAHSQRRNPLRYITTITNPDIHTPSHRAYSHSEFDLSFSLHDGKQHVKLTLEPNTDIIATDAVVTFLDDNGQMERQEPLHKDHDKVYRGGAWLEDENGWNWAGWARIVLHQDGFHPLFEGAFLLNHDAHHIHLQPSYMRTRHLFDPVLMDDSEDIMVVFRDSDVSDGFVKQSVYERGLDPDSQLGSGADAYGRGTSYDIMCPSDNLPFNTQLTNPVNQMIMHGPKSTWSSLGLDTLLGGRRLGAEVRGLVKRQSIYGGDIYGGLGNSAGVRLRDSIGLTDGCPKTRQVALIGVVTDCTYTGDFQNEEETRRNVIQQINSASALYENTFNITLGLSQLIISKSNCPGNPSDSTKWNQPCTANATIEDRLHAFSEWRTQKAGDGLALWALMTTCETGTSVGLAWLGQLCQSEATRTQDGLVVSGVLVVAKTSTEWKVLAHEIAHSMGAVHDCTSQTCSDGSETASMCCPLSSSSCDARGRFLMNPTSSVQMENFSPCSVGNICSAFKMRSVDSSCLTSNKNVTMLTEKVCGNGIVEEGEDCDCGGTKGCGDNKCCDPSTCKFKSNAVCDDSNEDCCEGCQFAPATKICRPSNGQCDPQETCSGTGPSCPPDVTSPDGTDCDGGYKCASGQCTSRDRQCQMVMGQIGSNNNDTTSCDSSSCLITCQSPELGPNICMGLQQNFLDGTPCDGNGVCKNGYCSGATPLGVVGSWISRHKTLVIGLGATLGAILLISILSCCLSRFRSRRRAKKFGSAMVVVPPHWHQHPAENQQQPTSHLLPRRHGSGGSSTYPVLNHSPNPNLPSQPPIPPPPPPGYPPNSPIIPYHPTMRYA